MQDITTSREPSGPGVDTIRALCHDLRQPVAAILLLAGAEGGDVRRRLDGILEEAQWLSDMVEAVIGGAAGDRPVTVDVTDLARCCALRAQPTATCQIGFFGADTALVVVAPVALSRALSCVLDNAVRAAGPHGRVTVEVTDGDDKITIRVTDDGPGLGQVLINNSLGLTITRALVSSCGGSFDLSSGGTIGVVAQIVLPASSSKAIAS